jgi:branched-chain amino acid transport system ATP-binding protein
MTAAAPPPLLDLRGVTALYGHSQALFGVDLTVRAGQVTALMGRNGMGKTTTIRTICRLLPNRAGEIFLDGHDLSGLPPHRVARMGVGLVPEGRRVFAPLSVRDNLVAAARPGAWDIKGVVALFPRLGERMGQGAGTLSGGEQQMLAIGRALMTNPRLLILDEATEGLAPTVRSEIWQAIGRLKQDAGLGILLVDKSLRELTAVADSAVVLDKGRSVWAGPMTGLTAERAARWLGV